MIGTSASAGVFLCSKAEHYKSSPVIVLIDSIEAGQEKRLDPLRVQPVPI